MSFNDEFDGRIEPLIDFANGKPICITFKAYSKRPKPEYLADMVSHSDEHSFHKAYLYKVIQQEGNWISSLEVRIYCRCAKCLSFLEEQLVSVGMSNDEIRQVERYIENLPVKE